MNKNHSHIKALFIKLRVGHEFLKRNKPDNQRCVELVDRSEPIFDELAKLGVSRAFSTTLLIYGKEFLTSLKAGPPDLKIPDSQ